MGVKLAGHALELAISRGEHFSRPPAQVQGQAVDRVHHGKTTSNIHLFAETD